MRRLLLFILAIFIIIAAVFIGSAILIQRAAQGRIYDRVDTIPSREFAVVLGTSEHLVGGGDNPYFKYRIDAASKLYHLGKVKHLVVSGDNHLNGYNEPENMRRALIAKSVPNSVITMDYAGLRTLDSIIRAKKIFGLRRFTIISQRDHDQRAILIANYYGLDAIGYAAEDVPFRDAVRAHIHEWEAEVMAVLDLYILHTQPRYLGPHQAVH